MAPYHRLRALSIGSRGEPFRPSARQTGNGGNAWDQHGTGRTNLPTRSSSRPSRGAAAPLSTRSTPGTSARCTATSVPALARTSDSTEEILNDVMLEVWRGAARYAGGSASRRGSSGSPTTRRSTGSAGAGPTPSSSTRSPPGRASPMRPATPWRPKRSSRRRARARGAAGGTARGGRARVRHGLRLSRHRRDRAVSRQHRQDARLSRAARLANDPRAPRRAE